MPRLGIPAYRKGAPGQFGVVEHLNARIETVAIAVKDDAIHGNLAFHVLPVVRFAGEQTIAVSYQTHITCINKISTHVLPPLGRFPLVDYSIKKEVCISLYTSGGFAKSA